MFSHVFWPAEDVVFKTEQQLESVSRRTLRQPTETYDKELRHNSTSTLIIILSWESRCFEGSSCFIAHFF